jgi:hypothetical protein
MKANLPSRGPSLLLQKCIAAVALALTGFVWPIFFADEAMNYLTAEYSYQPRGLIGIAVWLGPLTAFVLIWALWYQRWIRTNQSQLVRQQLAIDQTGNHKRRNRIADCSRLVRENLYQVKALAHPRYQVPPAGVARTIAT